MNFSINEMFTLGLDEMDLFSLMREDLISPKYCYFSCNHRGIELYEIFTMNEKSDLFISIIDSKY